MDIFSFLLMHRARIAFSQVTALPKARPAGNPRRYPHIAHRFAAPSHKSSTGLRTGKPWLAEAPAGRSPAPLPGTRTAGRTVHAGDESAAATGREGAGRGSPGSPATPMIRATAGIAAAGIAASGDRQGPGAGTTPARR